MVVAELALMGRRELGRRELGRRELERQQGAQPDPLREVAKQRSILYRRNESLRILSIRHENLHP